VIQLAAALAGSWAYSLFRAFRNLGIVGLFLLSALDSSFLFLPFGNDLMLIALISGNRSVLMAIGYVIASVIGSVVGVLVIDALMRKAGEKGLQRFVSKNKIERLKKRLETKAWISVFVATLLPPPFPFTPVIMSASALQASRGVILSAVALGRLIRFTVEAVLAMYFGRTLIAILLSPVVEYAMYTLLAIAIIGSILSVLKWVKRSKPDVMKDRERFA